MGNCDEGASRPLHDWLYDVIIQVCGDRDYLYRLFVEHFCGLMGEIFREGGTSGVGAHAIEGIKSGRNARLTWKLQHRLDYAGPNILDLEYVFTETSTKEEHGRATASFELGTGDGLPRPSEGRGQR